MVEVVQDTERKLRGFPPGHKYGGPCKCRCSGGKRLRYVQPTRQPSYAPVKVYRKPDAKILDKTTYKISFEAFDPKVIKSCKGTPTLLKENLTTAGSFSGLTTHKMSYGTWPGMKRDKQVHPQDHRLTGEGPISSLTTNKHDFTPKPIEIMEKVLPIPNLGFSRAPMESHSTMILSYQRPDFSTFELPVSFKPQIRYMPPSAPVDGKTIHKLSFPAWEPAHREDYPWKKKAHWCPPKVPIDGGTIYNGSFIAPGQVIEDDSGNEKGCYCRYMGECCKDPPGVIVPCPAGYDPNTDGPRSPPLIEEDNVN